MKKKISAAIKHLKKSDPRLAPLFKRHGDLNFQPRIERSPFESLVRSIAHQQLTGAAAETILRRFLALYPGKSFPSPHDVLKTEENELRGVGFSQSKVKSIRDIAQKSIDGVIPTGEEITKLPDEEIIERLTACFGVGPWTVQMLLIFQLGRMDVWPIHDFGVQKGFKVWLNKRQHPKPKHLVKPAAMWAPHRTVVALYLWREADLAKTKVKQARAKKK